MISMNYNSKYADFTLNCSDGNIEVHRVILSSLSFWKNFFDNDPDCKSISVPFSNEGVMEFIEFYYSIFNNPGDWFYDFKYIDSVLFGDFSGYKFYHIDIENNITLDRSQMEVLLEFIHRTDTSVSYSIKTLITLEDLKKDDYFLYNHTHYDLYEIFDNERFSDDDVYKFIIEYISKYPPKESIRFILNTPFRINRYQNMSPEYKEMFANFNSQNEM